MDEHESGRIVVDTVHPASARTWPRVLPVWVLGTISPWVLFAVLLGVFVQMSGAKSFSGMSLVAVLFALGLLALDRRWRSRLKEADAPAEKRGQ
jgi:hypothetical protein